MFLFRNRREYIILKLIYYILVSYIGETLSGYGMGIEFDKDPFTVE